MIAYVTGLVSALVAKMNGWFSSEMEEPGTADNPPGWLTQDRLLFPGSAFVLVVLSVSMVCSLPVEVIPTSSVNFSLILGLLTC